MYTYSNGSHRCQSECRIIPVVTSQRLCTLPPPPPPQPPHLLRSPSPPPSLGRGLSHPQQVPQEESYSFGLWHLAALHAGPSIKQQRRSEVHPPALVVAGWGVGVCGKGWRLQRARMFGVDIYIDTRYKWLYCRVERSAASVVQSVIRPLPSSSCQVRIVQWPHIRFRVWKWNLRLYCNAVFER